MYEKISPESSLRGRWRRLCERANFSAVHHSCRVNPPGGFRYRRSSQWKYRPSTAGSEANSNIALTRSGSSPSRCCFQSGGTDGTFIASTNHSRPTRTLVSYVLICHELVANARSRKAASHGPAATRHSFVAGARGCSLTTRRRKGPCRLVVGGRRSSQPSRVRAWGRARRSGLSSLRGVPAVRPRRAT